MSQPQLDLAVANALVTSAVQHMQVQVGQVAETQRALSQLWHSVLDPTDIEASFERFTMGAETLILAARSRGQLTAQQFYQDSRQIAGVTTPMPTVPAVAQNVTADLASLYSTGYATAQRQTARGVSTQSDLEAAQSAVLRSAQRRILDAPRQRIIDLSEADDSVQGWARVGDGDPCYFCAMLIGRGPVYHSQQTASFLAHDGCGCNARLVFKGDPSGGWTSDSYALHRAWYGAEDGKPIQAHSGTTLADWRKTYADLRADPTSHVSVSLAGPRTAYAKAA